MSVFQFLQETMADTVWGIAVHDIFVVSVCLLFACVADIFFIRKLPGWLDKISEQVRLHRKKMLNTKAHQPPLHGPDAVDQSLQNSVDQSQKIENKDTDNTTKSLPENYSDELSDDLSNKTKNIELNDSSNSIESKNVKKKLNDEELKTEKPENIISIENHSNETSDDFSNKTKNIEQKDFSNFIDPKNVKKKLNDDELKTEKPENKTLENFDRSLSLFGILVESLKKPLRFVIYLAFLGIALKLLNKLPGEETPIRDLFVKIVQSGLVVCLVWYAMIVTNRMTKQFSEWAKKTDDKLDDMLVPLISSVVKFLVIFIGVLLIMQSMGYQVSSLIAGLGIGGAALALASKDTLANLFGAFVVFFDKPFEIGDWISVNGVEGEVEEIRLRTTIIRTWDNSVVTLPNQVLSTENINNYERRHYRKMECDFGVLYSTTSAQIKEIVENIRAHIAQHAVKDPNNIQLDELYAPNYYVAFKGFGDSSLDIEVTVFTVNRGLAQHINDRQEFLLEIMRIVEKAGTGFAFPTRTLEWAPGMMPAQPRDSR